MAEYLSSNYPILLQKWSTAVLDTLDELASLQGDANTGNVDSLVAELLFRAGLLKVYEGREADLYSKIPQFDAFLAMFKQTSVYRDMEQVRQSEKKASSTR